MAGTGHVVTITAAGVGVDVGAWERVPMPASSPGGHGDPQVLHVEAGANASAGSATVYLAIYDRDAEEITMYEPVTLTATAREKHLDGASGTGNTFDCTVSALQSGNRKVDLLSFQGDNVELYIGAREASDFTTLTSVTVRLKWTSKV